MGSQEEAAYLYARPWYGFKSPPESDFPFQRFKSLSDERIREELETFLEEYVASSSDEFKVRLQIHELVSTPETEPDESGHANQDGLIELLSQGDTSRLPWFYEVRKPRSKLAKIGSLAGWLLHSPAGVFPGRFKGPALGPGSPIWFGRVDEVGLAPAIISALVGLKVSSGPPVAVVEFAPADALDQPTRFRAEKEIKELLAWSPPPAPKPPMRHTEEDLVRAAVQKLALQVGDAQDLVERERSQESPPGSLERDPQVTSAAEVSASVPPQSPITGRPALLLRAENDGSIAVGEDQEIVDTYHPGDVAWAFYWVLKDLGEDTPLGINDLARRIDLVLSRYDQERQAELRARDKMVGELEGDERYEGTQPGGGGGKARPTYSDLTAKQVVDRLQGVLRKAGNDESQAWRARWLRWDRTAWTITLALKN